MAKRAPRRTGKRAPGSARLRGALAVLAILLAGPAAGGAWPREPGTVFLSLRGDVVPSRAGRGRKAAAYLEYGLTERVTLGGQWSDSGNRWDLPRSGGFVNVALGDLAARNRFAVSFGASTVADMLAAADEVRLDLGAHWGRGFESRFGPGWATASYLLHLPRHGGTIRDAQATLGVRPRDGWMAMLGASSYSDDGGTTRKLAPAVGVELREEVWGVLHVTREFGASDDTWLGLALWWSFGGRQR